MTSNINIVSKICSLIESGLLTSSTVEAISFGRIGFYLWRINRDIKQFIGFIVCFYDLKKIYFLFIVFKLEAVFSVHLCIYSQINGRKGIENTLCLSNKGRVLIGKT